MSSKHYFDEVAGQWDTMRSSFFSETVRDQALAAANVQPGDRAADIGAGSGFLTEALIAAGASVIAVDQSPAMLDVMRKKFGGAPVEYRVGTSDALPLDDGSVQHALANMVLHHVEHPPEAIREMARTIRPGGTLVITDLDAHDFTFLVDEHHDRWMGFQREDVQRWFEAAGLENVRVSGVGTNCCADSLCGSQRADVSIFIATGTKPA
jgi:ubiquinone/menaquinone biosynthesis C-methylase UbiE